MKRFFVAITISMVILAFAQYGTAAALRMEDSQLQQLFGGGCETGCENGAAHCPNWSTNCVPAAGTSTCIRCTGDTTQEKCADWGYCIGGSCSTCVSDDGVDCGTQNYGSCPAGGGACQIQYNDGTCGTAYRCHTKGGW